MAVVVYRNLLNALVHQVLDQRAEGDVNWTDYTRVCAGIPAEMRINGVYLAFAYLLAENNRLAQSNSDGQKPLVTHGQILADIAAVLEELQACTTTQKNNQHAIGTWVDKLKDLGTASEYMEKSQSLFDIVDVIKRVAKQKELIASARTSNEEQTDA